MTAPQLLGLITAALLVQLMVGVVMLRRRSRGRLAPLARPADAAGSAQSAQSAQSAWAGWREFRVVERVIEDAQASQCSFYLQPVDGLALPAFKPGQFLTFALELGPSAPQCASPFVPPS